MIGSRLSTICRLAWLIVVLAVGSASAADLLVGPGQTYTTIQAAVDAAAATGDTIYVAAGTYSEQVTVDAKDLAILGAGPQSTIVAAPAVLTSLFNDGQDHFGVVAVRSATVRLAGLGIDGQGAGNLHERFHGVLLHNAGGELFDLAITAVRNTPRDATPHGVGLAVLNDDDTARDLTMAGLVVDDFQQAGIALIAAAGTPLDVSIDLGEVTGAGPIAEIAQVGLQVTGDVTLTLDGTTVRDLAFTGPVLTATGVLIQDASGTVANLEIDGCQTSLWLSRASLALSSNQITVPRPTDFGRGVMIDNVDPAFERAVGAEHPANPYAPERRPERADRATLVIAVTGCAITLAPDVDDPAGTIGLRAENIEATDDLELTATDNVITGVGTAIELRDATPTSGSWLVADCNGNTFNTVDVGLDSDLALLVAAEDCWWGALDGPGGDGPGSGVAVLGNVDVDPWQTDVLNLVCAPESILLTEVALADTVVFTYTGGASGRIYGFSIDVEWDPTVAVAEAAVFTLPTAGPFAAADYVLPQNIGPGQVRVDVALGSFVPGAYSGPLFQAAFAFEPDAAHLASTTITATVLEIRDNQNDPLAGLVPAPGTIEIDSTPVLTGVLVTDTTIGSSEWLGDGHDLSVVATVIESRLDSLRCDLTAFGGPVLELADATVAGDQYTWTFSGTSGTGDGEVTAPVTAVDTSVASASASGTITADNTAPAIGPAGLVATPGHEQVHLAWDELGSDGGSPLTGVEFRYVTWGNYPAYAGPLPDPPATTGDGLDPGLGVVATTSVDWTIAPRDVYVVAGFQHDLVGNVGTVATSSAATNYWLGDHDGDGYVDVLADLTALGDSYGLASGAGGYDPVCDVGPTFDGSPRGIPHPEVDGYQVQFEDLMVTALNHDEVDPDQKRLRGPVPALRWEQTAAQTWVLALERPCDELRGINLRAGLPDDVACTIEAGELLAQQSAPIFLRNIDRNGLDVGVAAMGPGAGIEGAGELVRVVLSRELASLPVTISARDQANHELLDDPEVTGVELPAIHRLDQNQPNPFNPRTTIAFALPVPSRVELAIYGVDGRLVRKLVDEMRPAGRHEVVWTGRDQRGRPVATGTYFYALTAGDFRQVRKMTLLK